jgi:hypothetical protein
MFMDFEALDVCVRDLRREMIDFTTELVAVASENPPGSAYPQCIRVIESTTSRHPDGPFGHVSTV